MCSIRPSRTPCIWIRSASPSSRGDPSGPAASPSGSAGSSRSPAEKLPGRDSNPNYQSQNLACCQLHHPATGRRCSIGRRGRTAPSAVLPHRYSQRYIPHSAQWGCPLPSTTRVPLVMPDAGNGSVQLLEADPELARGLDPRRVREVSQRLFARAIDVPRGPWSPARALAGGTNPIGLLVLDGLLVREAIVGDHPCAELLGPGDLLRAWEDRDAEVLLPRTVEWSALSAVRLAVIDQALAVRAA